MKGCLDASADPGPNATPGGHQQGALGWSRGFGLEQWALRKQSPGPRLERARLPGGLVLLTASPHASVSRVSPISLFPLFSCHLL